MLMLSPLGAEMFCAVKRMNKDNEGLFNPAGAYAQAYSLFSVAVAIGVIVEPIYPAAVYEKVNWQVTVCVGRALC